MKNCFLQRAYALTHELAQQLHVYKSEASTREGLALLEMIQQNQIEPVHINYLAEHKAIGMSSNAASHSVLHVIGQYGEQKTNDSVNHHLETTGTFVCV